MLAGPGRGDRARALAAELSLPCVLEPDPAFAYLLAWSRDRLEIRWTRPAAPGPVTVDFLRGPEARRWRGANPRSAALARAMGLRSTV